MSGEKFNLAWSDFDTSALQTLRDLLVDTDFVDVTLASVDVKQTRAHKVEFWTNSSLLLHQHQRLRHCHRRHLPVCSWVFFWAHSFISTDLFKIKLSQEPVLFLPGPEPLFNL